MRPPVNDTPSDVKPSWQPVDAHQHFWLYSPEEYPWMGDDSLSPLRHDRLPDHLSELQKRQNFKGSIAVQARQKIEETTWLLELSDRHPDVMGVVGWVDLQSNDIHQQLESFAAHKKFVGVRHVVQDEPDDHFMARPAFRNGIAALKEFDLAYDILIYPQQLQAAIDLVKAFPDQRFVLDHMAKPVIREKLMEPWKSLFVELSHHPNVHCKISGLVTEADWQSWTPADLAPYIDIAVDAFSPERIMIGSDWPVCTLAATYAQVTDSFQNHFQNFSENEQIAIFRSNALNFYKLH